MLLHRVVSLSGRALGAVMIGCVHGYRLFFSPLLPPSCRYVPTCSTYAIEAIRSQGPVVGGVLILRRLVSCHPWGGMGYDPVPAPGLAGRLWKRLTGRDAEARPCAHPHHHHP